MSCSITLKIVLKKGLKLLEKNKRYPKGRREDAMSWTDELGEKQWGTRSNKQSQGAQRGEGKKKRVLGWQEGSVRGHKWKQLLKKKRKILSYSTRKQIRHRQWDNEHPAYSKCIFRLALRNPKDAGRTNSPFWDPPLFTVSRNSGAYPTEAILYHRRVSSLLNRDAKHQEVLTQAHTALFLPELSKYERKLYQVIKQANPLEMTNYKTLCGKWDIPSASPVFTKKKKPTKSILLTVKEKKFIDRWSS